MNDDIEPGSIQELMLTVSKAIENYHNANQEEELSNILCEVASWLAVIGTTLEPEKTETGYFMIGKIMLQYTKEGREVIKEQEND